MDSVFHRCHLLARKEHLLWRRAYWLGKRRMEPVLRSTPALFWLIRVTTISFSPNRTSETPPSRFPARPPLFRALGAVLIMAYNAGSKSALHTFVPSSP